MSRTIKDTLALLLSAVLLSAPFNFQDWGFLAFFAFLPALICLEEKTSSQAFKRFFLLGMAYHAAIGYWLNYVNVFGFLLLSAYLSLYFAFFGLWVRPFLAMTKLRGALFAAALWVMLEYVRGWMFSGFPWTLLGYSQWRALPVIQMADITGPYGVSFLVLWVNVMLYHVLRPLAGARRLLRPAALPVRHALWLGSVAMIVLFYGWAQLRWREGFYNDARPKAKLAVSVLQGNIPQEEKWDSRIKGIIFEKYKRLTQMGAMEKADLVVWPETSFPGYLEDEPVMSTQLRSTVRHAQTSVLVGAPTIGDLEKELKFYNSAILYGANGEETQRYHKEHLVPFGEYVPFEPLLGFIRHFVAIGRFSPGAEASLFSIVSHHRPAKIAAKFSVLICYEDIFPGLVRRRCRDGADFLVNISNDAWFGKTAAPYQHAMASVFRAVENRVPVVRATNTGYSCFITAEGRITGAVQQQGQEIMVSGYKTQELTLRKGRPFYTHAGELVFVLCLVLLWMGHREKQKLGGYSRI